MGDIEENLDISAKYEFNIAHNHKVSSASRH